MRSSTRSELNKLREVVRFVLREKKCFFCHKPLIKRERQIMDGTGRAEPVRDAPTIHHFDNNTLEGDALAHPLCHRRFEAKKTGLGVVRRAA